jgi:hypothetical protein
MNEVACKEEKRMLRTFLLIGPLLIVCTWLVIVALHVSILHLLETKAFETVSEIQKEGKTVGETSFYIAQFFWMQMRKDLVILFLVGGAVLSAIILKTKLYSYPYRLKEIKKYKFSEKLI